jgi:hypothetical protein
LIASLPFRKPTNAETAIFGGIEHFVTTFGIDAEIVRRYVRHQEEREKEDEEFQKGYDLFPDR